MLPHGARVVAKVPETAPSGFRSVTGFRLPGIAMTLRIWVVHEPFGRVVRFVQTHAHPRPRPEVRFRGKDNGLRLGTVGWYEFAPVPGRSWQRWLNVDMAPLRGGGTAVIAQAGDAWVQGSRGVLLPAAVKRIDILSRIGSRHPNVLVHVRRPYDVGSIVSFVNGLGLANSSRVACLAVLVGGPTVTLRFRTAEGRLLARATVQDTPGAGGAGPCSPLQLTVRGRNAPPLIAADLLLRIQRLLGINLAPVLPHEATACLRGYGWKVQSVSHKEMVDREQHSPPELVASRNGRRWTITFHYTGKTTLDRPGPHGLERCIRAAAPRR